MTEKTLGTVNAFSPDTGNFFANVQILR